MIVDTLPPAEFKALYWPHVIFYAKQWDVIDSVRDNTETYVVAGNQLGKDFVTGFVVLWAFLCHKVARVITTSVKDDHLRVLWGEILRFIQTAERPLTMEKSGPLRVMHREIRKRNKAGKECSISYLLGCVSEKGEGLSGHHAPYTLLVGDEASGLDDTVYSAGQGWAKRFLWIGNPNSTRNFFRRGVESGDLIAKEAQ